MPADRSEPLHQSRHQPYAQSSTDGASTPQSRWTEQTWNKFAFEKKDKLTASYRLPIAVEQADPVLCFGQRQRPTEKASQGVMQSVSKRLANRCKKGGEISAWCLGEGTKLSDALLWLTESTFTPATSDWDSYDEDELDYDAARKSAQSDDDAAITQLIDINLDAEPAESADEHSAPVDVKPSINSISFDSAKEQLYRALLKRSGVPLPVLPESLQGDDVGDYAYSSAELADIEALVQSGGDAAKAEYADISARVTAEIAKHSLAQNHARIAKVRKVGVSISVGNTPNTESYGLVQQLHLCTLDRYIYVTMDGSEAQRDILTDFFCNRNFSFHAYRAAEIGARLAGGRNIDIRVRDMSTAVHRFDKRCLEEICSAIGVEPVRKSFKAKPDTKLDKNVLRSAMEAYWCALLADKFPGTTLINTARREFMPDMKVLHYYVQATSLQSLHAQMKPAPLQLGSCRFDGTRREGADGRPTKVPDLEVQCLTMKSMPAVSNSVILHVKLWYGQGNSVNPVDGSGVWTDAYGLCYKTSGDCAYICFPFGIIVTNTDHTLPDKHPLDPGCLFEPNHPTELSRDWVHVKEIIAINDEALLSAEKLRAYDYLLALMRHTSSSDRSQQVDDRYDYSNVATFVMESLGTTRHFPARQEEAMQASIFPGIPTFAKGNLTDKQFEAARHVFDNDVTAVAIEGPPGTGKTMLIGHLLMHFDRQAKALDKSDFCRMYNRRARLEQNPFDVEGHDWDDEGQQSFRAFDWPCEQLKPLVIVLTKTNEAKKNIARVIAGRASSVTVKSHRIATFSKDGYAGLDNTTGLRSFASTDRTAETLAGKTIVICTLGVFASIGPNLMAVGKPQALIIDETSLIVDASLVSLLSLCTSLAKIVLVGDVHQMPPFGRDKLPSLRSALNGMLTERKSSDTLGRYTRRTMLDVSFRLPSGIAAFFGMHVYGGGLLSNKAPALASEAVMFIEHSSAEERRDGSTSLRNPGERNIVLWLLHVVRQFASVDWVVLTFYADQQAQLQSELVRRGQENDAYSRVFTVDSFQGREADVVILCTVKSTHADADKEGSFVLDANRLTVALTRCKSQLVIPVVDQFIKSVPPASLLAKLHGICDSYLFTAYEKERTLKEFSDRLARKYRRAQY